MGRRSNHRWMPVRPPARPALSPIVVEIGPLQHWFLLLPLSLSNFLPFCTDIIIIIICLLLLHFSNSALLISILIRLLLPPIILQRTWRPRLGNPVRKRRRRRRRRRDPQEQKQRSLTRGCSCASSSRTRRLRSQFVCLDKLANVSFKD